MIKQVNEKRRIALRIMLNYEFSYRQSRTLNNEINFYFTSKSNQFMTNIMRKRNNKLVDNIN